MCTDQKKTGCQFTVVGKRFEKLNGRIQKAENRYYSETQVIRKVSKSKTRAH